MVPLLVCLLVAFGGSHAAGSNAERLGNSTPPGEYFIYACAGDTLTLPWIYGPLLSGQEINNIAWALNTVKGHEMIAMFSHGTFLPGANYGHRVQQVGNAGISLTNVQVKDSGNYTVELDVVQNSQTTKWRRNIVVRIHDTMMTTDGILHVSQSSEVVLDPNTGRFAVQLTCGEFTFNSNPPFKVEWVTPLREVVNSTDFQDHHFRLLLQNPIQEGAYECLIPAQSAQKACAHGDARLEAQVFVDKTEARLSILEKEKEELKAILEKEKKEKEELKAQLQQLNEYRDKLNQLNSSLLNHDDTAINQVSSKVDQFGNTLKQVIANLHTVKSSLSDHLNQSSSSKDEIRSILKYVIANMHRVNSTLSRRLVKLEEAGANGPRIQVAFQATGDDAKHTPPAGSPILFKKVLYNQGNGYDNTTGYFTAPYPGTYFFIATTGGSVYEAAAEHTLMVDRVAQGTGYTYRVDVALQAFAPAHAVVHLNQGQRVWPQGTPGSTYEHSGYSMFSGFLVAPDP